MELNKKTIVGILIGVAIVTLGITLPIVLLKRNNSQGQVESHPLETDMHSEPSEVIKPMTGWQKFKHWLKPTKSDQQSLALFTGAAGSGAYAGYSFYQALKKDDMAPIIGVLYAQSLHKMYAEFKKAEAEMEKAKAAGEKYDEQMKLAQEAADKMRTYATVMWFAGSLAETQKMEEYADAAKAAKYEQLDAEKAANDHKREGESAENSAGQLGTVKLSGTKDFIIGGTMTAFSAILAAIGLAKFRYRSECKKRLKVDDCEEHLFCHWDSNHCTQHGRETALRKYQDHYCSPQPSLEACVTVKGCKWTNDGCMVHWKMFFNNLVSAAKLRETKNKK